MKKLALCITLAAFSIVPVLQADDAGGCGKNKEAGGCCPASKQSNGTKSDAAAKAKAKDAKTDASSKDAKGAPDHVKK